VAHERRLADAGLAGEEDQPSFAALRVRQPPQSFEEGFALEQKRG
jgi:hypothetical protein